MDSTAPPPSSTPPGELPPLPPKACFGRDGLIKRIVGLADSLTPFALIGPGGIGKTSIALTVLHHDHIKKRFGGNRRFIRCDQFPASRAHFLNQLSKVIGAGVENPGDLTPLQPFLSSKKMILFLDNAESILDPRGADAQEIYAVAKELSQFSNICLCITSRISTIPPACEILNIPTLPMEAACDAFYQIYKNGGRSDLVNNILGQLNFHPLSVTLLATVAYHNQWDTNRLSREWERQRTDVLQTHHNESLARSIELSLASPMFQELGPDARELLGVIAFFPQGVDENNIDWLFPTLPNRTSIFDSFCILSLTYRSNGFITMLAPLQDHLCPKDPASSPLLCTTKDHYFHRLSVFVAPGKPGFNEARWIVSEDVNVEHLLDVFTSIDANSVSVWDACAHFIEHIRWHKRRLVTLGPKIKGLPDDHPSKPKCLLQLSQLLSHVGNHAEKKLLLIQTLKLWREQGNDFQVAQTLRGLSNVNRELGFLKEGIQEVEEALGIYKKLNDISGQAYSWQLLGRLLYDLKQFDAAEEAISQAINLPLNQSNPALVCRCHRVLGDISLSKGEAEKAINHFEAALEIASSLGWQGDQFWIHYSLAKLFFKKHRFNDADSHIGHAKALAIRDSYQLGRAMELQAQFWFKQNRLEEAKSEVLDAATAYEKIGAMKDAEGCRVILRNIEKAIYLPAPSHK